MLEQIKQALEKATQGPWQYQKGGYARAHIVYEMASDNIVCSFHTHPWCEHNGHLIASAPEWLKYLIDEVERYQGMYQRTEDQLSSETKTSFYLRKEVEELQRELSEYREEEDRPRFKMDAQGNLSLIEEE